MKPFQKPIRNHLRKRYSTKGKAVRFVKLDYPKNPKGATKALIVRGLSNPEVKEILERAYYPDVFKIRNIAWTRTETIRQGYEVRTSRAIRAKGGTWE
jgi:hypothetical protein